MGRWRFALLLLLAGCPRQLPLRFGPEGEIRDPNVLLRSLEHRSSLLRSLTAGGRITVHGPRDSGTTGMQVAVQKPGYLRLEGDSFFGNPVGLLATDGERVEILDVDHGVFSEGAATAANLARLLPVALAPADAVGLLLADPARLPVAVSVQVDPKLRAYALTLSGPPAASQTLYLDTESLALVGEASSGHVVWYKDLEAQKTLGGLEFPREIDLSVADAGTSIVLHYRDLQLNPSLEPAMFVLKPPAGARFVPLD